MAIPASLGPVQARFECTQPILRVDDMQAALRFYVDVLGFQNAQWGSGDFTSVNREGGAIYLCRGGARIWIGVDDVQALHRELQERGVPIRMEPTNHAWALEMQVEDPSGNVIRFGSEPLPEK